MSAAEADSGTVRFAVTNAGDDVTEFYLLGEDGLRVVSEVENVGPGLTRDLVVAGQARHVLHGVQARHGRRRHPRRVHRDRLRRRGRPDGRHRRPARGRRGASTSRTSRTRWARSSPARRRSPTRTPRATTRRAQSLYADTRAHWERVEPVAESFGDLDPLLDLREADVEEGATWSGWHLIEKDLWQPAPEANGGVAYVPLTPEQREAAAADLVDVHAAAGRRGQRPRLHVRGLPDRQRRQGAARRGRHRQGHRRGGDLVAHRPVGLPGQRRRRARRLRGARGRRRGRGPRARRRRWPPGSTELDTLLAEQGSLETGFTYYDELTDAQVKALAAAVDALSEPLSRLTATVTGA